MAANIRESKECRAVFHEVFDVDLSRNPWDLRNLLAGVKRIREVVISGGYDIVHVHTPVAAFITRLSLRKLRQTGKVRVVYTAHGFHFYRGGPKIKGSIFWILERIAARWCDVIVLINKEDFAAASRLNPRARRYMPGIGVDLRKYNRSNVNPSEVQAIRSGWQGGSEDFIFISIGELSRRKRPLDVINAFAGLRMKQAKLVFAGDGPLRAECEALVNSLGLSAQVIFLGFTSNVVQALAASDCVILASSQEGLPRCLLESMSMGIPFIATSIRGTEELLESNGGLGFQVGDIKALTGHMDRLMEDPSSASRLGETGQHEAWRYSLENIVSEHENLYNSVN